MRQMDMKRQEISPGEYYEKEVILRDQIGPIDISAVSGVEFTFGPVRKLYPQQVSYNGQKGAFTVRFDAKEAGQLLGVTQYQARIVFADGSVKGTDIYTGRILGCAHPENLTTAPPFSINGCSGVARNAKRLVQGDSYALPVTVTCSGKLVAPEDAAGITFVFGALRKRYPDEVQYDAEAGVYIVPLSQQETFAFDEELSYYALVEGNDGALVRSCVRMVSVERSISKEVL